MKKMTAAFFTFAVFFLLATGVSAYQSHLVADKNTIVENPQRAQAFYGELQGAKNFYQITSGEAFDLYVSLLVPDISGARKDVSAEIYTQQDTPQENGQVLQEKTNIAMLNGVDFNWSGFYEPWMGEKYFQGPAYASSQPGEKARGVRMEPGTYKVQVFNPDNEGKYVLVIGTEEQGSLAQSVQEIKTLPKLKREYFGRSPLLVFWNLTGLCLLLLVVAALLIAWTMRKLAGRRKKQDRDQDPYSDET